MRFSALFVALAATMAVAAPTPAEETKLPEDGPISPLYDWTRSPQRGFKIIKREETMKRDETKLPEDGPISPLYDWTRAPQRGFKIIKKSEESQ